MPDEHRWQANDHGIRKEPHEGALRTSRDRAGSALLGGVISGFGLGFAYIVPITMLQKRFPDKRGLITGLAVGGFGFGAVLTSPIAQRLIDSNKDMPTKAFPRWASATWSCR